MERRPDIPVAEGRVERQSWPSSPLVTSAPSSRPRSTSLPLIEAVIYRPGPGLALVLLLAPILSALIAAATYIGLNGAVPIWLPLLLLVWIPLFVAVWFALKSVRYSTDSIAVARPWQRWREIALDNVEAVEMRGPSLRLYGAGRTSVSFIPGLLRDGPKLRRQLLLRLPLRVLDSTLRQEARRLNGIDPLVGLSGQLPEHAQIRPRRRWAGLALLVVLLSIGAGVIAWVYLPLIVGIVSAILAAVVALLFLALTFWLRQEITVDEKGLQVHPFLFGRRRYIAWHEVEWIVIVIGAGQRELVVYLHGARGVRCAGPALFRPDQRDLLRAYIHAYCDGTRIPTLPRPLFTWLFSGIFTLR